MVLYVLWQEYKSPKRKLCLLYCLCLEVFRTGRASGLSLLSVHYKHAHCGCLKSTAPTEVWCVWTFRWECLWNPGVLSITGYYVSQTLWTNTGLLFWHSQSWVLGLSIFVSLLCGKNLSQFCQQYREIHMPVRQR